MRRAILLSRSVQTFSSAQTHCPLVKCRGLQLAGRGEVVVDRGADSWPAQTNILCWHCAQAFDTPPVPKPVEYRERLRRYVVRGNYCCWGCAAADCKTAKEHTLLQSLHQAVHGRGSSIRKVPPKYLLKAFGGVMTPEEYRTTDQEFRIVPSRLVTIDPLNIESESRVRVRDNNTHLDMSNVTASNEVLKLKRLKPLTAGRGLTPMHATLRPSSATVRA